MKISLEHLDARALRVELPGEGQEVVAVRAAKALRGALEQASDRLVLSGVVAEHLELEALRLLLGSLVLAMAAGATAKELEVALEQTKETLELDLTTPLYEAPELSFEVDDVHVRGRVALTSVRLSVRGDDGSLSCERLDLTDFVLRIGAVELVAERLLGLAVEIAWGQAGFQLVAGSLEAPSLRLTAPELRLDANGVDVRSLALHGTKLSIGKVALERGDVAVSFPPVPESPTPIDASPAPPTAGEPLVDMRFLDALSGQLDVDVVVDLTVPIIGRRHATHRLRVAIDEGSIDYRALEKNLSRLEDALLDFSVRDGALVLERVNPLFPTRGHGKPVVIWDVDAAGLELAKRDRVRLAVLPEARLASEAEEHEREAPPSRSSIVLRQLELRALNARLAMAPIALPSSGQLRPRHLGSLSIGGSLFHDPGGAARPGSMLGELSDLAASIDDLVLGTPHVDLANLSVAAFSPIEIAFSGLRPTQVQLGLTSLVLDDVTLTF